MKGGEARKEKRLKEEKRGWMEKREEKWEERRQTKVWRKKFKFKGEE